MNEFEIKFTLAFIKKHNQILMLRRRKKPNINMWNGLGGKIENGENHYQNIERELMEEAGIMLEVKDEHYKGLITWKSEHLGSLGGSHLFLFDISGSELETMIGDTREGLLEWKTVYWASDIKNNLVVDNIPIFIPYILNEEENIRHHFDYDIEHVISNYVQMELK